MVVASRHAAFSSPAGRQLRDAPPPGSWVLQRDVKPTPSALLLSFLEDVHTWRGHRLERPVD